MAPNHEKRKVDTLVDKGSIRVLVIGCVLIVAVVLFMSISSTQFIGHAVVTKLKTKDLVNLSQSYGAVIEGKIDRAVDASLMLSADPEVAKWVTSAEKDSLSSESVQIKMANLVKQFGYQTAFLVSNKTYHYWSYHDNKFELLNTVSQANSSDAWFFNLLKLNKRYEINIDYNAELKNTYVWINVLVGDINHPVAITGLGMNLGDVIQELITENKQNNTSNNLWLVNGSGMVKLATNAEDMDKDVNTMLPSDISARIAENRESSVFKIDEYTKANGQVVDIAYRPIRDTDWKLVIQIPREETTGFLAPVTRDIVIAGFGIVLIILLLFFILTNKLANPYKRAVQLNRELEQIVALRTSELEERNQKIQDSIDYARSIQQTILPSESEFKQQLHKHFVLYKPKDVVGGDFYWMKRVESGLLLMVGDCTGHGVAGALMTTAVNAMLNEITEQIADDPAGILAQLDRRIKEFVRQDSAELIAPYGLDAGVFYFSDTGSGLFAGAALSAFLWDGAALTEIPSCSGTIDSRTRKKERRFINKHFDIDKIQTFYVTTDGFPQQPGGPKGLPFGKRQFANILSQIAALPIENQQSALWQAMAEYRGSESQRDDVTVLGFQIAADGGENDGSFLV